MSTARRRVLQRGDERQLDALTLLVAGLWRGPAIHQAELLVRVGLDPDRLGQWHAGTLVGVAGRAVVDRQDLLRTLVDQVQARVGDDPVQPGLQRPAAVEAGEPAPGPQ